MNAEFDMTQGFTVVKAARALIVDVNKNISDATKKQYTNAFDRMQIAGTRPEKIANTIRSFYFYRAAWVFHYATSIRTLLQAADAAARQKNHEAWQALIKQLPTIIQKLELYRPDPHGLNLENGRIGLWAVEAEQRLAKGDKISTHSKRTRLRGLPANWQSMMFDGVRPASKYKDVVATLSATGARPGEFENGIKVEIDDKGALRFTIQGIKTHNGKYGQAERSFSVQIQGPETRHLAQRISDNAGPLLVKAQAGALSDKVRQLSDKVFPNLRSVVSAYVFRHQVAADLKASGLSDTDVSTALGHSVDETKRFYGAAQSARAPGGISNIHGSTPVRAKTREKVLQIERSRDTNYERQR